ncbi:hypothetical protein [Streptomyces canus]|uniref:hypothetical protein n=1 Tax=Streptomyces canus TaxID=58343 RepID=UPI002E2C66FE|nr:hypothetical protein [Streptomyces canus]
MSSSTLAFSADASSLVVSIVFSFFGGALAVYGLMHRREVFAWTQRIRKKDADNAVYNEPDQWLSDLYKAQSRRAKRPSRAEDMEEISQTGDMIRGIADHIEAIRPELTRVIERVDAYLNTALPARTAAIKVAVADHEAQLVQAMKQEAARSELAQAISSARQKITALRRD